MEEHPAGTVALDVEGTIQQFIKSEVLFDDPSVMLTDETSLLDGIMDSMALMQLVSFLEEEFGVEIDDIDITKSHFASVATMAVLIRDKLA